MGSPSRALPLSCLLLSYCGFQSHEVPAESEVPTDSGTMSSSDAPDPRDETSDAGRPDGAVPTTVTVQGRVMGPLREPCEGSQVALGDRVTTTDQNGSFTFEGVSTPYDLSLYGDHALWRFLKLTRPDPTLQNYGGCEGPVQGRDLDITPLNVPELGPESGEKVVLALAFGSDRLATDWSWTSSGGNSGVWWVGGEELPGVMHAFAIARPEEEEDFLSDGLSNRYLSYTALPFVLESKIVQSQSYPEWRQPLTLDFAPRPVSTQPFQVRVQADWGDPELVNRPTSGLVVFDTNAPLFLTSPKASDAWNEQPVTVLMPVVPESRVVFVASQHVKPTSQFDSNRGYGCAHGEAVSALEPVVLNIPEPRRLTAPEASTRAVNHSTVFTWSEGDAVSHLRASCQVKVDGAYSSMTFHVITKENSTTLPKGEALGIELPQDGWCSWQVTIHNAYPTVDAALHPQGMIAPCTSYAGATLRGEGSASVSESRVFFLAP